MTIRIGDKVTHLLLWEWEVLDAMYVPKTKKTKKEKTLLMVRFKNGVKKLDMNLVKKVPENLTE